jgi:hypothetical protein
MSKYITTIHQDSKNKKFIAKIHCADTHEVIFTTSPCSTIQQTTKQAQMFLNERALVLQSTTSTAATAEDITQPKIKNKKPSPFLANYVKIYNYNTSRQ